MEKTARGKSLNMFCYPEKITQRHDMQASQQDIEAYQVKLPGQSPEWNVDS